ncbi:MAG: hypothetical protein JXA67_01875 [Micromonosporaceae bacterium]|nr:hypothetical protein [Micromonosporaceae bacterium]
MTSAPDTASQASPDRWAAPDQTATSQPPARNQRNRRWLPNRTTLLATLGAAVTAAIVAFATGGAQSAVTALTAPKPTATSPGSGLTAAVDFVYPAGQSFALPDPLVDGHRSARFRAGFSDLNRGLTGFLRDNAGAARERLIAKIVLTGRSDRPTRITGLRVNVITTAPVLAGTLISLPPPQGEGVTTSVTVDFDRGQTDVMQGDQPYFAGHTRDITKDDRVTFVVAFSGTARTYRWVMAVDCVDRKGAASTRYVDSTGHDYADPGNIPSANAFSITGTASQYAVKYASDSVWDRGFHITS